MEIHTKRLLIIPCSLDMAKSLIFHRKELGIKSPIKIPDTWPSLELKGYLPFYIEKLEADDREYGWGIWMMIELIDKMIIGNIGFKGRPNHHGEVEIAYHVAQGYRRKGYGYEAVQSLTDWAFTNNDVKKITAECADHNEGSVRILEKVGMKSVGKDNRFLKWELCKE